MPSFTLQSLRSLHSLRTGSLLLLLAVGLSSAMAPAAQAQITITQSDQEALVGERLFRQEFTADTPANAQPIVDAVGPAQTYDFRSLSFSFEARGVSEDLDVGANALAGAEAFAPDATIATRVLLGNLANPDSTANLFQSVTSSEVRYLGSAFVVGGDIDSDGDNPDTLATVYSPGRFQSPLPVTYTTGPATTWSSTSNVSTVSVEAGVGTTPVTSIQQTEDNQYEVTGYGRLITEAGAADVLRIRRETSTEQTLGGTVLSSSQTTQILFASKEGRLNASIDLDASGGIQTVTYNVRGQSSTTTTVNAGATGSVSSVSGLSVALTTASSSPGALATFRYDGPVPNPELTGTAEQSGDGTVVAPENVADGYYIIEAPELSGFEAEVCLETSGLPGIADLNTLIVGTRVDASQPIEPLQTSVSGTQICASVTGFSEFFVTGGAANPLPVELADFAAETDGRRVSLSWATLSETNNAGFSVEHAAPEAGFQAIGSVEGAGTTATPQRYTFRTDALPIGTHRFRLRQTDFDGTATLSDVVRVDVQLVEGMELSQAYPNPTAGNTTLTIALAEQQPVTVSVYDAMGRRVAVLHDGPLPAQTTHSLAFDASRFASGIYLVRATGPQGTATRRIAVVR